MVTHQSSCLSRARFLSLARSKLRLCSANHRLGYWVTCPVIGWAQPELTLSQRQKTGPGHPFLWGRSTIWWPVDSPHKGLVTQKTFPYNDVIMYWSYLDWGFEEFTSLRANLPNPSHLRVASKSTVSNPLGLYSQSGRTSYGKISRSLEAARFGFKLVPSLWNLTGTSAAPLPRCLLNFRAIWSL